MHSPLHAVDPSVLAQTAGLVAWTTIRALAFGSDPTSGVAGVSATFCSHSFQPTHYDFVPAFSTRPALAFGLEASNKSAQPSNLNEAHPNRAPIFALTKLIQEPNRCCFPHPAPDGLPVV
jgi:hypothetical protein